MLSQRELAKGLGQVQEVRNVQHGKNRRRKTKIVCTIGPATKSASHLGQLANAGMNVARLNLAHGTHDDHLEYLRTLSKLDNDPGCQVAIMLDLPGPKYRIGALKDGPVLLKKGHRIVLTSQPGVGDEHSLTINSASLPGMVKAGDRIFLSDGAIQLKVEQVHDADIEGVVVFGGVLAAGQGVVVPGKAIPGPFLTDDLKKHIDFAIQNRPDYIALSFVRGPDDILQVKRILQQNQAPIPVVAKIERGQALTNFDEILAVSDAIMVARGDLGVDIAIQRMALVQKEIIKKCNRAGKPVITATQMLESMVSSPRPTRAEVTDIANAIFDGTDALMLSGETSIGTYPALAVRMMAEITDETENVLPFAQLIEERSKWVEIETDALISYDACYTANKLDAAAIVAFTQSGSTAQRVSRYRPKMPIIAITPNKSICGKLTLYWGVQAVDIAGPLSIEGLFATAARICKELGLGAAGDDIVITGGIPVGMAGTTNLLKVEQI